MLKMYYLILLGSLSLAYHSLCVNVIKNPGFESGSTHLQPWVHYNAENEAVTDDVHSGSYAQKLFFRRKPADGLYQSLDLEAGKSYKFKAFIKQLDGKHGNLHYNLFQNYNASIEYRWTERLPGELYITAKYTIAFRPLVEFGSGWITLEGDHAVPKRDYRGANLYINGPEADVDFLVDDVSLEKYDENTQWKEEANERIEKLRKSTVHLQVSHPPAYNPDDIEIHIRQTNHLFGFGCLVDGNFITNPEYKEYQDIFYRLFNWATLADFDWDRHSSTQTRNNYTQAVQALEELIRHGVQVRGNAMFWGVQGKSPDWVENMDENSLKSAIDSRVDYITNLTAGKITHWNVNNELLHGQIYEEITREDNYTETIFDKVHIADPDAKLFLNDLEVVSTGAATKAYIDLANKLNDSGVGLYGLGANSDFQESDRPDPALLKKHLDDLETTGLPIWISGLRSSNKDANVRADTLEIALRTYFSHPAVEGVTIWGLWDHESDIDSSLFYGFTFELNAVGQRYLDLVQNEWSTNIVYNMSMGPIYPIRAFQGDYDLTVYYQGKLIKKDTFHVDKGTQIEKIEIDGSETELTIPTTVDPLSYVNHNMHIVTDHNTVYPEITDRSTATNTDLQCVTRKAVATFRAQSVFVNCEDGELLTGCSGYMTNLATNGYRYGEMIDSRSTPVGCTAYGRRSSIPTGLVVFARCCKTRYMSCTYLTGSVDRSDADVEPGLSCPYDHLATGCGHYLIRAQDHYGSVPTSDQKGCVALTGAHNQVYGDIREFATCCQAPNMACKTVTADVSGLHKGDNSTVSCDQGYVITSCTVKSYTGKSMGAYIETTSDGEQCVAINGEEKHPGEEGSIAVAVCCQFADSAVPDIVG